MSASDASALLSAVKWSDEGLSLQEFVQRIPLPQVAKIIKGQFKSLGVPTLPNPSLNQTVFLSSIGKRIKVVAQCVKFKEGRGVVPVGPILAIPEKFEGWFEILSEDGRTMRYIESVAELVRRFPDTCVVRENIKAFVLNSNSDSGKITDKTRVIRAGETLVLVSEVSGSHFQKTKAQNGHSNNKFLRCFDVNGESVYFGLEQTGKFSPVAGEENISGVHTIKNLLRKRMPITVKMVHGKVPSGILKNCYNHNSPEMRLLGVIEEECMAAMPLLKDLSYVVTVPMCAGLKLQAPRNNDELRKLREYVRLSDKCEWLGRDNADKMHVLDMSSKSKDFINIKNSYSRYGGHNNIHQYFGNIQNQIKKLNGDGHKAKDGFVNNENVHRGEANDKSVANNDANDARYDEIDVIYDYVRGFRPLPKSIAKEFENMDTLAHRSTKKLSVNARHIKHVKNVASSQQATAAPTPKSPKAVAKPVPSDKKLAENGQVKRSPQASQKVNNHASSTPREASKVSSVSKKKPVIDTQEKVKAVIEDTPPEPPPIETIPVRRSVSMPNATATNIVVMNVDSGVSQAQKSSSQQKLAKGNQKETTSKSNHIDMTDNVAYSNFIPQAKDNVYDKVTHEHEPFTIDLKSPNVISRGHHKESVANKNNNESRNSISVGNNRSTSKLFVKSQSPTKSQRSRLFKHSISTPCGDSNKISVSSPHFKKNAKSPKTTKISVNSTTKVNPTSSPIFNLRYKSLTDLALDFDTLDSSNSGGQVSSGSAESNPNESFHLKVDKSCKDDSNRKLPRPRSLTNLVWPANEADCINNNNNNNNSSSIKQYNNIMSNLFNNNANNKSGKKYGNGRKFSDGVLIYGRNGNNINSTKAHKRLSALYL